MPVVAAVLGEEHTEFRTHEQQVGIDVVFDNRVCAAALRQVARDQRPALATVIGPEHVRPMIAALVIVYRRVGDIGVVERGHYILDQGHIRHAAERVHAPPGLAAVLGDVHDAVVRADVDETFGQCALGERDGRTVDRG